MTSKRSVFFMEASLRSTRRGGNSRMKRILLMATELSVPQQTGTPLRIAKMMVRSSVRVLDCNGDQSMPNVARPWGRSLIVA